MDENLIDFDEIMGRQIIRRQHDGNSITDMIRGCMEAAILADRAERNDIGSDYKKLLETFGHYHVASGTKKHDACKKCGLDIRHEIHYRVNDERLT